MILASARSNGPPGTQPLGTLALIQAGYFILRFVGTCAVFYPFFLCRTIGAGDIKLMGVITGFLGVWDGVLVIGLGMVFAAVAASCRMIRREPSGSAWSGPQDLRWRPGSRGGSRNIRGILRKKVFAAGAVSVCGILSVFTDPVKRRERISYRTV